MRHLDGRSLFGVLAAAALSAPAGAQERTVAAATCPLQIIGPATIKAILDSRTFTLVDGREIRLAGIETPADGPGTADATAALDALLATREITLKRLNMERDRHGRVPAYVFAASDERSAQHNLLAAGHARVAAQIGNTACAAELLQAERAARAARLGIWALPHYLIRGAENPAAILAERGRFTLVEGQVLSVRESGGTIYVNFGRRWSEDFTVTVPKRSEKTFIEAGLELKKLSGRRVRVRGTIEERGGPWIEAIRPEQIEIADRN